MALSETAKLIAELGFKDKLSPGVDKALGSVGRLDKGLGRAGKGAGQLGAGMARAGVLIAGAAVTGLGAAAKAAINWEDAFAGVVKTVDEADLTKAGLTFRDLELSLRKMSTTMPIAASDLAAIAEAGGAMGIAGKDIEEFTRVVALIGTTTNVATEDAATALGQLSNVLGLTAADFDNFASALVDLGNKGASTEAEILTITSRAGAGAKLIGVAADATLGWAAATANLGIEAEAGGSALQKFFLGSLKNVAEGGDDLAVMAKTAGLTGKAFKKAFDKDASGALAKFLGGLGKLDEATQLNVLKQLGFSDIRITRLLLGLAGNTDNLTASLNTGATAWEENTAAQIEFDKRNATVRSGITRLKNSLVDAAVTLGEGFAPALGRSAAKLSEFLAQDANRSALKAIGEDIGKAIDDIDWKQVLQGARTFVTVMKSALSFAKLLLDAVMALPTELKAAGLGLIGLNKLSGGLVGAGIGNIVGGLAETTVRGLGSKIPGVGKLFAQPVFVTNWPIGGLGGGVPGAGGKVAGAAGIGARALVAGGAAAAVVGLLQEASKEAAKAFNAEFSKIDIATTFQGGAFGPQGILPAIQNLVEVVRVFGQLNKAKPVVNVTIDNRALDGAGFRPRPAKAPADPFFRPDRDDAVKKAVENTTTAVETMRGNIGASLSGVKSTVASAGISTAVAAKNAGDVTKAQIASSTMIQAGLLGSQIATTLTTGFGTQGAIRSGAITAASAANASASRIVSAIFAARPVINATTVNRTSTVIQRYGPSSSDRHSGPLV